MAKVAFIGLGVMGFPMAGHLRAKGAHQVTVFNRTQAKADAWISKFGGRGAATPAEAARGADYVFCCVGDDPDLRQVTLGPQGAFASMAPGTVFIDHTTASASVARELAAAAKQRDFEFLDAPVSGGQAGAENGALTVMVGGDPGAFARAQPAIACYARAVTRIGDSGCGQLAKMVNQISIVGLLESLAEAIAFGRKAGLDMKLVLEVLGKGAAQSWQMDSRGGTMIDGRFDFGFAVDWMRKDLRIAMEQARALGAPVPVARLVDGFYAEIQNMGGGRWDTSSLIRRLK